MRLTREEQAILDGEEGEGQQRAMELVTALGRIYNAEKLFPVKSVQVSGVSYANLGGAGLEFLDEWANTGVKVSVPTLLNPAGMDLQAWESMGIPEEFAEKQAEVIKAYKRMGVKQSCTCTPYLIGLSPEYGQHVAWSESSAVTYVNSVIGARTNREGGPSALAAAIVGKTPYYGLHVKKNRAPELTVEVRTDLENSADFGALGYCLGKDAPGRIPYIRRVKHATDEELKALSASIVTYGGPPLFHMEDITPEIKKRVYAKPEEKLIIDEEEVEAAYEAISDSVESIDFVSIGCPHCSLEELKKLAQLLKGKKVNVETWVATARRTKEKAKRRGYVDVIEGAGARIACDTCMAVAPLKGRFHAMATNSAKGCYYARGSNAMKTYMGPMEECIKIATKERK